MARDGAPPVAEAEIVALRERARVRPATAPYSIAWPMPSPVAMSMPAASPTSRTRGFAMASPGAQPRSANCLSVDRGRERRAQSARSRDALLGLVVVAERVDAAADERLAVDERREVPRVAAQIARREVEHDRVARLIARGRGRVELADLRAELAARKAGRAPHDAGRRHRRRPARVASIALAGLRGGDTRSPRAPWSSDAAAIADVEKPRARETCAASARSNSIAAHDEAP